MLIVIMLTMTVNLNNVLYQSTQKANTKSLVGVVDSVIYADLNNAGYARSGVTFDPKNTFYTITSSAVSFYADIISGSGMELVKYYTTYSSSTGLYTLYRQVNSGTALKLGNNFSNVTFKFYDAAGAETADKLSVKQVRAIVQVRYVLQNAYVNTTGLSNDTCYVSSDFRVVPPNLL
jgi:hypothetical protein